MSTGSEKRPRRERTFWKLIRLAAYCAAVGVAGGGLALGSAYGSMKDTGLELGHELGKMDGAGSEQPILLNGEPIFVSSAVEDVPLEELLDRVEARCQDDPSAVAAELSRLPAEARRELDERFAGKTPSGVVRHQARGRGMVACFMREGPPSGLGDRLGQLGALLETGDLSSIGKLRYVFAEKTDAGLTHVVTAWTDGPFNLYSLMPNGGDAPGSDPEDAPRPEQSVRLLTATIDGAPYSVRIYDSGPGPQAIFAQYDREMAARGWQIVIKSDVDDSRRVYGKDGVHTYVITRPDKERTLVTLLQMGHRHR